MAPRARPRRRPSPSVAAGFSGDGSDPTRDHTLREGELLTRIVLPAPLAGERAFYTRATLAYAASLATAGARPLPQTGYKLTLLPATVLEVLERAARGKNLDE